MNNITIDINGYTYTSFLSYDFYEDIEALLKTFSITLNVPEDRNLIKQGDIINVKIDNEDFLKGYIEKIEEKDEGEASTMRIQGRDILCDLVDSRIGAKIYQTPINFVELVKQVLMALNYTLSTGLNPYNKDNAISIINNYGNIDILESGDDIKHRDNDSAFELIKRCADKRRLILTSDGRSNLVINKLASKVCDTILVRFKDDELNNILNSEVDIDYSQRYYKYIVKSIVNGSGIEQSAAIDPKEEMIVTKGKENRASSLINGTGIVYDNEIRKNRILTIFKQVSSIKQANDLAQWEADIRKTQSFQYGCRVFGFRQNLEENLSINPLWKTNMLVDVQDEVRNVFGRFLIKSVRYSKNDKGTNSYLTLVNEKSYTNSLFEPIVKNIRGKRGDGAKVIIEP